MKRPPRIPRPPVPPAPGGTAPWGRKPPAAGGAASSWPLCPTVQWLSPAQRRVARLCQVIRYGQIAALPVRDGQPDLSQPLRWLRAVKVTGANAPHPGTTSPDAGLPHELVRFFQLLEALGSGVVHDVEVRDGLPMAYVLHEGGPPPD